MKVYKYKGKLYCDVKTYLKDKEYKYDGDFSDLLLAIEEEDSSIYSESTTTIRYIGGDYFGTDDDKSEEETIDEIIDQGYGDDIELEKVEEEE